VLLVIFEGVTDRLIPLFAVGALTAFSMSQWGMVAHWRRVGGRGARHSMVVNVIGATATSLTTLVVVVSKFVEGAWITVLVIAAFIAFFRLARYSRDRVVRAISTGLSDVTPLDVSALTAPIVIVPLRQLDRVARRGLRFAMAISPDVQAVLVQTDDPTADAACAEHLAAVWHRAVVAPLAAAGRQPIDLVVLPSEYREFFTPFLHHVRGVIADNPGREVAIVVPEVVERKWYDVLFASHRPAMLKAGLRLYGGKQVLVIDAPWHISDGDDDSPPGQHDRIAVDPMPPGM
jgi:hypothetical protein